MPAALGRCRGRTPPDAAGANTAAERPALPAARLDLLAFGAGDGVDIDDLSDALQRGGRLRKVAEDWESPSVHTDALEVAAGPLAGSRVTVRHLEEVAELTLEAPTTERLGTLHAALRVVLAPSFLLVGHFARPEPLRRAQAACEALRLQLASAAALLAAARRLLGCAEAEAEAEAGDEAEAAFLALLRAYRLGEERTHAEMAAALAAVDLCPPGGEGGGGGEEVDGPEA